MKRYNNLFDKIVSLDNLYLADKKARRNKSNRKDIKEFDQNKEESLKKLQQDLINRKKNITMENYKQEMCSHIGWLKHCNGINLLKKILRYKELLVYARRFSKQKP